jgi:hypothetical protein
LWLEVMILAPLTQAHKSRYFNVYGLFSIYRSLVWKLHLKMTEVDQMNAKLLDCYNKLVSLKSACINRVSLIPLVFFNILSQFKSKLIKPEPKRAREASMKLIKQTVVVIWIALLFVFFSPISVIGDEKKKSGKDLYKQDCRVCHEEDSDFGDYTPMSLTQDQWIKFFKDKFEKTHKDVVLKRENKKLLEYMTPKTLKSIKKFCVDHAADSEQPQTCSE